MSSNSTSVREDHPRREIHFNITTAQSNGKVSEANYDSPDEAQEKPIIQQKKMIKLRGESAKAPQQSPLLRNNYLLAFDNNEAKGRRPPLTKSAKSKDFPISASTFFQKSPSGLTLGDKGFGLDSKSKHLKKQRKLALTQHTSNAFGMRSQSEKDMNRIKGAQRDPQDIAHNLHLLKIQYNNVAEENTRLKTRNKNLEAVINTLYDDLNNQQLEIQKIYQGKQVTPTVLLTGSQLGLKRQLREERLINKNLNDDLENLKKSLKATSAQEQAQQIQFYLEECVRLRSMLELEIRQNKQTALTMIEDNANVLTATTEEERKRILSELERQNEELKIAHKQIKQLTAELDQARLKRHEAQKLKQMGDLKTRQAFLIKAKGQQVRTLEEQLQLYKTKCENYERKVSANTELSKQFNELNQKLAQRNAEIKTLKESLLTVSQAPKLPKVETSPQKTRISPVAGFGVKRYKPRLSYLQTSAHLQEKVGTNEEGNQLLNVQVKPYGRQMSVPLVQRPQIQQARPKDDFEHNSNKRSLNMDTSPTQNLSSRPQSNSTQFFKKTNLSKSELVIRGLNNFKALAEKREQPNNDIDQAFYKTYSKDIQQLFRKMQHLTLPVAVIKKLLQNRVLLPGGLDLQETVRLCAEKFSVFANELQVCEIILNHFIPCITADNFELQKFYTRLEVLLNTHSDNSMQSHDIDRSIQEEQFIESEFQDEEERVTPFRSSLEPGKIQMFDSQNRPVTVQVLSLQEEFPVQSTNQQQNAQITDANHFDQNHQANQSNGLITSQPQPTIESGSSEYSQPNETESQSMSAHSGNMIDYIDNVNNSITEEQMLDTAEQILNTLANKLIENGWTVHDVFGQPEEIVRIIAEYENQRNIKVISASNFLGRVYQVGIQNLTQLQVACLMRVLGKPEFDDSVRYDELELLLENFGVTKDQLSIMPDDNQDALQFEEEKVQVQQIFAGSPINESREISEEVVFIDDTKPMLEFQNRFEDQQQRKTVPEVQSANLKANTDLFQVQDYEIPGRGLKVPRLKDQPGFDSPKIVQTEESKIISKKLSTSSQLRHPTSSNSINADRFRPEAGLDKNANSRTDSTFGNTPTFVHQSAGQKSSGVSTHKSNLRLPPADFDEKEKSFTNEGQLTELKVETDQPAQHILESQSHPAVEQKESRLQISKQTLQKGQNEKLGQFFCEVLGKISFAELLVLVEKNGYKQQIKSKTTFTETSVINLDSLLAILEPFSKHKLNQDDIKALQECVQLTPKFSKIIAVKHFATFLKEAQEFSQKQSRQGEDNLMQMGRLDRHMDF